MPGTSSLLMPLLPVTHFPTLAMSLCGFTICENFMLFCKRRRKLQLDKHHRSLPAFNGIRLSSLHIEFSYSPDLGTRRTLHYHW